MRPKHVYITLTLNILATFSTSLGDYKIGVGIADCTGPAVEIPLMGYGKANQKGCGIHLRQFSRAFIFDDGVSRAAFVTVDVGMISYGLYDAVLQQLNALHNDTYSERNLILSGTHTHSGPGGFLMDFMYDIPSLGFINETFVAFVDGIVRSVVRAHENMVDGKILLTSGELLGANINRSPTSYLCNPKEEREKYQYDVDKEMVQLKLVRSEDDALIGAINWFAVHGTSMNNTNCLVTSDNVGYASVLLEKSINKNSSVGKGPFVGAFASTNLGDVSPNTKGARCITTGEECTLNRSTCDGEAKYCIASGPGNDMFESTKIIAEKLFDKAKMLLNSAGAKEIKGPIRHIQRYVHMPSQRALIKLPNGTEQEIRGCLPAMGYSFAAGTTDGYGEYGFSQGTLSTNFMWNIITDLLSKPTADDKKCHHPKPILINSGRISVPYQWQPTTVSNQIIQVGELLLIAVPGEFTTMSGRRLRNVIEETAAAFGGSRTKAIITGLSNVYSSYITTPEEYQNQRYEGASTIFGPHTLTLYLEIYKNLTRAMLTGGDLESDPKPANLASKVMSITPGVLFDAAEQRYGSCVKQPPPRAKKGTTIAAKFVSGHPRNDVMHEKTFLTVEKFNDRQNWTVVATDADWETKFVWRRRSSLIGGSEATVKWEIPADAESGIYRIRHFGYYKSFWGRTHPYVGSTKKFTVE